MKKLYRIILLLLIFIFVTTFNPVELNLISKKNNTFFKIDNIQIENNLLIKKNEIEKRIQNIYNKNIFFIKKEDIEKPLNSIDFLEKIEVKKKYPSTIVIKVFETMPVAALIKKKIKYIIDTSGNLIFLKKDEIDFINLPNIFGDVLESDFIYFYNELKKNNFPNKQIKNFYYFQIGRWDIELFNNKIIKFPHNNVKNSIIKSIELLNKKNFENYKIIDLRVNGKIIVE